MHLNPLLVLASGADGHLEVRQRLLAHAVPPRLRHLQHADQLGAERDTLAEEAARLVLVCTNTFALKQPNSQKKKKLTGIEKLVKK